VSPKLIVANEELDCQATWHVSGWCSKVIGIDERNDRATRRRVAAKTINDPVYVTQSITQARSNCPMQLLSVIREEFALWVVESDPRKVRRTCENPEEVSNREGDVRTP
jgi:hypothetical protein